jgi:hypothetical protein
MANYLYIYVEFNFDFQLIQFKYLIIKLLEHKKLAKN